MDRSVDATINQLVHEAERGDGAAADALFVSLYRELHQIAERQLRRSSDELTIGTTTLLHEAYLALSAREQVEFPDRGRFLAYASKAMRGLVIDYCRSRRARKRGGEFEITSLGDREVSSSGPALSDDLERIGEAVDELATLEPRLAQLVDLHFFSGFSFVEIAELWGVSDRTVQRDWRKARMVLQRLAAER
ncbi:MAG: ECF-type sigma factor [Gemmatimonadaceae bacterium]